MHLEGGLTKQALTNLISTQRIFLLQLSRGYRTISTYVLTTLTGIPAIKITLKYEFSKTLILQLRQDHISNTTVEHKVYSWQIHPAKGISCQHTT